MLSGGLYSLQEARVMDEFEFIRACRARRNAIPSVENAAIRERASTSHQPCRGLRVTTPRVMLKIDVVYQVAQPMNLFRALPR